jgi:hypothetical protein
MIRWLLVAILTVSIVAFAASPYVGETSRPIKALSEQEVADYLDGKGMGFAKAAELNGYPGPLHVIELSGQLGLSAAQRRDTEAIFDRMRARAVATGQRLVAEERRLDELFASKAISPPLLAQTLDVIASLQRDVRESHLKAHLEQAEVLTAAQVEKYWQLRGYAGDTAHLHRGH